MQEEQQKVLTRDEMVETLAAAKGISTEKARQIVDVLAPEEPIKDPSKLYEELLEKLESDKKQAEEKRLREQSKFAVFYQPHRLHPNTVFTDSGGRIYQIQADGSLKRINKGERAKPKA